MAQSRVDPFLKLSEDQGLDGFQTGIVLLKVSDVRPPLRDLSHDFVLVSLFAIEIFEIDLASESFLKHRLDVVRVGSHSDHFDSRKRSHRHPCLGLDHRSLNSLQSEVRLLFGDQLGIGAFLGIVKAIILGLKDRFASEVDPACGWISQGHR